jgi:type I restriction enzyme R subunit
MAFYFVSTFAIAQTPTKQPALRLSRTKNLHFAKATFPGFSANEDAAKRYITASLKRKYASENGTELNSTLPKMSPLNPQYKTKKQSVFQKIAVFVEKFKGVGGKI